MSISYNISLTTNDACECGSDMRPGQLGLGQARGVEVNVVGRGVQGGQFAPQRLRDFGRRRVP